jgi:hypothetical protein
MNEQPKSLIPKGIKDGTLSDERCLNKIQDTVEMFHDKWRSPIHPDSDDEDDASIHPMQPCLKPSNWRQRLRRRPDYRQGKVYIYSKTEVMQYNELVYLDGPATAKSWADRRWYARLNV